VVIAYDITERKHAEEALKQSEAQFRTFVDNAPAQIYMKDRDGRYLLVNRQVEEAVGRATADIIGQTNAAFYPPDMVRKYSEHDNHVLVTGEADTREIDITMADGTARPHLMAKFPVLDADGKIAGVGSYATDITENKQAERALLESEQHHRELFEAAPFSIVLQDWSGAKAMIDRLKRRGVKDFRRYFRRHPNFLVEASAACKLIDLNAATLENYGAADKQELIAALTTDYSREPAASWAERLATLAEGASRVTAEDTAKRLDGGEIHVRMTNEVPAAYRDSWERVLVTDENITERKRAELALVEKEAQLRLALDNMPGGMKLVDRDLNYVLFNTQYSELCDFPDGLLEVGGSTLHERRYQAERGDFGPGDTEELVDQVMAIYQKGEAMSFEREIAGTGRTVQIYVAPTPEGGYVSIITDITERKRAEEEIAEKEAQLRLALDNMPGGMELVDRDWNYVFFNSQYSELHDYPDGLLKVGGSALDETRFQAERGDYGPGDPDELIEEAHAPFRSGEPESYERTLPGGRTLHFNLAPTPDGGYVTIAMDITERKRAEQELAEKEAQLRLALDNMPGGMLLADRDLNYVLFNSRYGELFEYPDSLVRVGTSIRDELRYQAERGDFGPGDKDELIGRHLPERRSRKFRASDRRQRTDAPDLPGADTRGRLRHDRHGHHRA
jgi:PAS domain S-box-containing protein